MTKHGEAQLMHCLIKEMVNHYFMDEFSQIDNIPQEFPFFAISA